MRALVPLLTALSLFALPALANDGFGGMSATGLTFGQTDAIAMVEEDLFISRDRITVDYLFRNTTAQDVTGEVIFPLPPIDVTSALYGMWNLPENPTDNLVGFTATVNGQPVAVKIDRIAILEPPTDEPRPASALYDTPGRDVTALLAEYSIPLSFSAEEIYPVLNALPPDARQRLASEGILWISPASGDVPADIQPGWSIIYRYHWTQTFPTGADLRVSHEYANYPSGSVFAWTDPPEEYQQDIAKQYCIDAGTSRAIDKALNRPKNGAPYGGMAYYLSYVLRTANSWSGPIGTFRLTLDKGAPGNVISFCGDGVKKTGPTTFVMEKENYTPGADLEILLISGP